MPSSPSDLPPEWEEPLHPVFIEALDKLMALSDRPSDAPEVRECVAAALLHAPEGLRESIVAECRK